MTDPVEQVPALRISVTHALNEAQSLGLETFIPYDMPLADLNALLDKLRVAGERQKAQAVLPQARRQLKNMEAAFNRAAADMDRLDQAVEPSNGRRNPNSAGRNKDRETARVTMERWKEDALKVREQIAELESVVNGS